MIYYLITELSTNKCQCVNRLELIEEVTGYCRTSFSKMLPGEIYYVKDYKIECIETNPKRTVYYKNLWRANE